eukprot:GFYU01011716.1.p1 GENE.GFYU01011716.1~~GFYU01011716.1.p1  ORF type:complete len:245 (+),score=37.56 GFYU01011716.1:28-762(+)
MTLTRRTSSQVNAAEKGVASAARGNEEQQSSPTRRNVLKAVLMGVAVSATVLAAHTTLGGQDEVSGRITTALTCRSKVSNTPDWWCNANCNHDRPYCPPEVCECDPPTPAGGGGGGGGGGCQAISQLVTDVWCDANCNHAGAANCPPDMCLCAGGDGSGGACNPADCEDNDPCTEESCPDPAGPCVSTPKADGESCDDDLWCNGIAVCLGGTCLPSPAPFCASLGLCDEENDTCLSGGPVGPTP